MDYLHNNYNLIKFYEEIYKKGCSVGEILKLLNDGYFENLRISDLSRFRVFLDACLLVYNKEKLEEHYFNKNYRYIDFENSEFKFDIENYYKKVFDKILNYNGGFNEEIDGYFNNKSESIFKEILNYNQDFSGIPLAIFSNKPKDIFKEVRALRNSYAHMQYKNFYIDQDFGVIYYLIYNIDKGEIINKGIAFEPVIHSFVEKYFSNQGIYGIPYKHTFLARCNLNGNDTERENLFIVKYKKDAEIKYKPNTPHPMKEYMNHQSSFESILEFIQRDGNFEMEMIVIDNWIEIEKFTIENNLTVTQRNWFIKSLYDMETSFSNFLLNIRQLNDAILEYLTRKKNNYFTPELYEKLKKIIEELKEDEDDIIIMKESFIILLLYNMALRWEKDELEDINLSFICEEEYSYEKDRFYNWTKNYYINNPSLPEDKIYLPKKYIFEKIRNALSHGNVKYNLINSELYLVFVDYYNGREIKIEISVNKLRQQLQNIENIFN